MCAIDDKFGLFLVSFSHDIKKMELPLSNLRLG